MSAVHAIRLSELHDDKALTLAVLQIGQLLGMYQAELARVLGLQCQDIGELAGGKRLLSADSGAARQGRLFVSLYEQLYQYCHAEPVAIYHWLRARHPHLGGVPLLLMVDEARLAELVEWLRMANSGNSTHASQV